jgi:hypothetical protein
MFTKTKIAVCVAVLACAATAAVAKDHNAGRNVTQIAADSSGRHAFGQAQVVRSSSMRHGSAAFAAAPARAPISGAEWWQSRGNADDMGLPYR